ncbi:unnamed protein product [Symbiodinium sp. CCMP2592]|nr:unnamed protein product [Symbiodinium sp. CCMP2592]
MADPAQSAATPVPEEDDFELFGPSPGEASQPSNPGPQPVPTVGPQQAPQPVPQQAPVPPAVTTTVGLDPQLQQLMLNMMQMQQQTLQVMMARMDADERRRREAEAASAAVADPFGSTAAAGSPSAKATAPPPPAPAGPSVHVGSNRAEKYLPALPTIDAPSMGKGRVKELEEYHRWCEVLASWLALIDDNYVNELRQAMVHNREIKQSEMSAPVASRSARLFYYLQQSLQKFERGMELVRSTSMRQAQAACGYEVMRQMHAGHYSWQCPEPPKGGKGKGKDKDKGKGGKPSGGGGRGGEPKGKGKGDKKGEKGKDKGKWGKPKAKPKAKSKGRAVEDEPSEQVMALRFHRLRGMRPGKAVKNEPNDAEPPRLTMTDKEVEKLNQSSSRNSHFAWLVDSGATCHVLSVASLSFCEVVKEHSGPLPVLMSASDTEMECLGLVDIRVKFGRLGPVVLQKVLVCQIGFNVISSWQEIGPARAKAKAKSKAGVPKGTPPKFGKEDDDTGDAMEVDRAKEKAHPNKHPQRALEVTPFKFLLRAFCSEFSCECVSAAEVAAETEVEKEPAQMMVMSERWQDLRAMQTAASSRRQQLVQKLQLSRSVEQRREAEELVAMNRCDSKELLHRGFHSLTSPALPSGEPPAPTQEGNEADDWGKWKAVPGPPASPPPPGTPERRAREKDQVAEDKKDHNEGERDKAAEGVALLREQELKMVAASKNLAEKERASAAAKAAANVAVEKWTPQQRARKEAELQAALLAQEQAAATVRLLTLELQLGDALGAPESSAAPEGAVESGTPPELPASRRISLSSSSVEAITPPGTPPTTPVSPGSAVPKTPQRSPLVKAMPKVPESPASQAAVSLVAPAAAGPVAQAAARPAVRVALRPPVRAVQVKAMPKVGQVPDVGHMGPPAPPMVGPMGPVPQAPQVVGKMHMFPPAPPFLGYMGPVPPAPPPGYRGIFNPWSTGPLRQVFGACVGCASNSTAPPYSETFSQAVKSTTANSKGNSSPYAKEERSITFDLRRCVSSEVLASTLGSRPVILKVSSSVSSPKKVQECGAKVVGSLEVQRPMMRRLLCLVRKVLKKVAALRGQHNEEAPRIPEAPHVVREHVVSERVVHRARMLAGLPVEITVESEEELLPDPEPKPQPPGPPDPEPRPEPSGSGLSPPEDLEVPVYITSERLRAHRNKGHQPYLSFCDVCQSARGRVPARRKNMKSHYAPGELQVDFGFFGRNVRFLLIVHVLSGYLSTVVLGPEDPVPVPAVCKALSEMGLNGLDIVVHGDQENLLESVFRDSAKHRTFVGRSMHWVPFAVNRPQAKGIKRWSVWLGLEERVGGQLPLGSYLFIEAMRYAVRMHNLFHVSKEQSTPLERLRGSTVQAVKSCEFGVVGFGKPQKDYPEHRGKRLVRAIYVGPHGANGSGIRVFVPLGDGKPPRLEIFSSFRARDPVEFDKAVLDQLKGNREDPERPIKFDVPLDAPQPPPDPPALPDGSLEFPVGQAEEPGAPDAMEDEDLADYSPSLPADGEGMDVEPPPGETADPTVHHRLEKDGSLTLVLVYVDDLIIFSQNSKIAKELYAQLAKIYKMKQTGILEPGKKGQLEFLGRIIVRVTDAGPVLFGLKPGYLKSLGEEFGISGKGVKPVLGNLEREYRKKEPGGSISTESYERYRRVLGKLMWASLTLPHLAYPVGFLGRFQSDPDSQAEACLRRVVRWVMALPEYLQRFSAFGWVDQSFESETLLSGYVDASWNVCSVSGAIVLWHGMMINEAALSISKMKGLLRRVRHLELRHRYLQELVQSERLRLTFIQGCLNPSDGLTKSPEEAMLQHLLEACGLERICEEDLQTLCVPEQLRERVEELENLHEKLEELPENLLKYRPVAVDLAMGVVPLLVVELFCARDSALCAACKRESVAYIGITQEEDFLSKNTQLFLGEVLLCLLKRNPPKIYIHVASPCTAGCSFRFKNWHKPKFRHRWREQMKKHVASWKTLGKLLQNHCQDVLLTQEWPKTCGLWKEETYQRVKKSLGLSFGREVDRCAFDLVYKRWWFACNCSEWCEIFSGKSCDKNHVHVAPESLEATGYYPTKLGRALLRAAKRVLKVAVGGTAVRTCAEDDEQST